MKKCLLFTLGLMIFLAPLQAQKKAGDYLNTINKEFKSVNNAMWTYLATAAHSKQAKKVEAKRKDLIKQVSTSITKVKNMPEYDDDPAFRDSAVAYLQVAY